MISIKCNLLEIKQENHLNKLNHFDSDGKAHMVDVGGKKHTNREATATGFIFMKRETLDLIISGSSAKGDVIGVSRIAAIQGSKKTSDLIPLCHPLGLTSIAVDFAIDEQLVSVQCTVTAQTVGQTGVEMEALAGVSCGLLTIYDMCKAVDRGMEIKQLRLLKKQGGKSGFWEAR